MNSKPGTYAIVLHCPRECSAAIGRLGEVPLKMGYYIYVGSAFGPGGVRARVTRHQRSDKTQHWHIDYLQAHMTVVEAWYTHDAERQEHRWASAMKSISVAPCAKGFGSSDCDCYSHLFHAAGRPKVSEFCVAIERAVANHDRIDVWTPG
ncbi:MAG: GIY-YIG nuclease family protein [Gammaproteobacteria bacterium]|nr:GIY-YIG nuclease family protein [Gammaproteobacteria bacterium]MDP7270373.1 GIY-YIG nuclease family protein [Gammaproteobacteria bacterium]HJP03440.1 GIY-YIG nuclease family protein [Gammaproteobacteria bacterium]